MTIPFGNTLASNACVSIVSNPSGKTNLSYGTAFVRKAPFPMCFTLCGSTTSAGRCVPLNANLPIDSSPSGKFTFPNFSHRLKASSGITFSPSGNETSSNSDWMNTLSPNSSKVEGRMAFFKVERRKFSLPMRLSPSGKSIRFTLR